MHVVPGHARARRPVAAALAAATALVTALGAALGLAACGGDAPAPAAAGTVTAGAPSTTRPPSPTLPPAVACARATLARLSPDQRAGQLFVAGVPATGRAEALAAARSAATVAAGNALLFGGTQAGVAVTRRLADDVAAVLTPAAGGVPPLVAADQEGGQIQTLAGPGFDPIPSALAQGGLAPGALRSAWARYGAQLRAAGVTLDFAPVADVVPAGLGHANQPVGRYDREFGHTPQEVSPATVAVVQGLADAGVLATVKHFPGLGRVIGNTDVTSGVTDRQTRPGDPALDPFRAAVAAGVPVVMVSSARYLLVDPAQPAVFSAPAMRLLRDGLGFTGLIASDDLGAAVQVADVAPGPRAVAFVRAGGQLAVVVRPASVLPDMVRALAAAARQDPGLRASVDAAATAVLAAKSTAGVLRC